MSLEDLSARLRGLADGERHRAGLEAAAAVLNGVVRAETSDHIRTGRLHSEARVVATADGVALEGPRYLPFVDMSFARGFTAEQRAQAVEAYLAEIRRGLG